MRDDGATVGHDGDVDHKRRSNATVDVDVACGKVCDNGGERIAGSGVNVGHHHRDRQRRAGVDRGVSRGTLASTGTDVGDLG